MLKMLSMPEMDMTMMAIALEWSFQEGLRTREVVAEIIGM